MPRRPCSRRTGIEPDIAIVKYKSLVGGGMMKIVNQTVPEALQRLGYSDAQVASLIKFIDENDTIEGAPELDPAHLPIFDCAFRPMNGTRSIHHMGHLKMMGAAQPFISGAISKTVNVPTDATPDDIADTYMQAWKLGIKAVAIYRDGSKRTQPLNTSSETPKAGSSDLAEAAVAAVPTAVRRRLPDERASITHKFTIGGHEGYLTVGLYPDTGKPGEIFIRMSKEGSSISGLMDSFATAISMALQYGVPLQTLVDKFIHSRFEPSGFTGNKEIPMAKSIMDYMFRYMALKFLAKDERRNVGLIADQEGYGDPAPSATQRLGGDHDAKNGSLSNGNGTSGYKNGVQTKPAVAVAELAPNATAQVAEHDEQEIYRAQSDAPPCPDCGALTVRNGACYRCVSCGTSLGCS
jgi:ribonucleoside-diphosphate reductase alpha chain